MADKENDNWTKLLKAGIGAALLAKDRISEEIDNVLEGQGVGKEKREELKERLVRRTEEEQDSLIDKIDDLLQERLEKSGFVRKKEFEDLEERIKKIEEQLKGD